MEKKFAVIDENNIVKNCHVIFESQIIVDEGPLVGEELLQKPDCVLCYDHNDSMVKNSAVIGYILNEDLKAFIPLCPDSTYILNEETFQWYPNPDLEYDIHKDGKLYRYNIEINSWIPCWTEEVIQE